MDISEKATERKRRDSTFGAAGSSEGKMEVRWARRVFLADFDVIAEEETFARKTVRFALSISEVLSSWARDS